MYVKNSGATPQYFDISYYIKFNTIVLFLRYYTTNKLYYVKIKSVAQRVAVELPELLTAAGTPEGITILHSHVI